MNFNRATIESMDDGTFSVEVCLPESKRQEKEDSSKHPETMFGENRKKFTASSMEEVVKKILSASSDGKEKEEGDEDEKPKDKFDGLMRSLQANLGSKLKEASK